MAFSQHRDAMVKQPTLVRPGRSPRQATWGWEGDCLLPSNFPGKLTLGRRKIFGRKPPKLGWAQKEAPASVHGPGRSKGTLEVAAANLLAV